MDNAGKVDSLFKSKAELKAEKAALKEKKKLEKSKVFACVYHLCCKMVASAPSPPVTSSASVIQLPLKCNACRHTQCLQP